MSTAVPAKPHGKQHMRTAAISVAVTLLALIVLFVHSFIEANRESHRRVVQYGQEDLTRQMDLLKSGESRSIYLYDRRETDALLRQIEGKVEIEELVLHLTDASEAGLASVATLPRLGKLVLYGGRGITDQALEKLRGMSSLHTLELNNTRVTNEGLRIFSSFPRLRSLAVFCEPRIGVLNDFGVVNLKSLSTLETLSLPGGWAFPEAVTQLRARLPNCRVVTNPPTGDPPGTK
jgi:hypothetical protein